MTDPGLATAFAALQRAIDESYTRVRDLPVTPTMEVAPLRALVASHFDLERARPLPEVVDTAIALLRDHTLHVTHPRYFGLFNPSVHPSGVVADALVALFNPQVAGWTHAPAANEMERLVLRHLVASLGLSPDDSAAHFTSGGNEANHTAVVAGLAARYPEWGNQGVRALPRRPAIYLSAESHHSFVKVARATGLGTEALRTIPVDGHFRMRTDALADQVARDRAAGFDPFMLVATAGTTGAGAIDPLPALAGVAAREDLWLHVDAAWGGAAALSPRLRPSLAGIERADSVTIDAHKWLSVPLGAGIFVCRHPRALHDAFGVDTGYVPPTADGAVDLYKASMQWSRRFMGLKLLFLLAEHGREGVARLLEHQAQMADVLRRDLRHAGWEVVNDTPLPLVCTAHPSLPGDEAGMRQLVDTVLAGRRVWVSPVRLADGCWAVRACITSWRTTPDDVAVLVEELERARGLSATSPVR